MDLFNKVNKPNEITPELIEKANSYRNDPTMAKIKQEFILIDKKINNEAVEAKVEKVEKIENIENAMIEDQETSDNKQSDELKRTKGEDDNDPANKKFKIGKVSRRELKRQRAKKICPSAIKNLTCNYGTSCRYSHDLKEFLETKLPDIDSSCYVFQNFGFCPFGVACRFSQDHIQINDDKSIENLKNEEKFNEFNNKCQIYNTLTSELKSKLWKRKYDYKRSEEILNLVNKYVATSGSKLRYNRHRATLHNNNNKDENAESTKEDVTKENGNQETLKEETRQDNIPADKKIGLVTDEDLIKLRKCEKKKIDWKNKLYLAPLTTAGNLPFRRICKDFGVDITCCEMAMTTNLLNGQASEWALLKKHESEDIFGVQLAGSYPDTFTKACQLINENCSIDFVDVNCGCPIDLVFNKGAGSALMTRIDQFQKIVKSIDTVLDVPVTVKIRTGIKEDVFIAHDLIADMKHWGCDMITLHGRTRQQRYSKLADWNYIKKCAEISDPIPLFGCGDILSHHDYYDHMKDSKIAGCMIARGALYKPWIFKEIKERQDYDISASERLDILKKYANYGMQHWGSDSKGVETTRRFLLEWLSFLHRYIPVGILESVTQQINLRPPKFFCRNQLESLFASPDCSDWIRISELVLGPVPDDFQFDPKHKANAY